MKRFFSCCVVVVLIIISAVSCARSGKYTTDYEASEEFDKSSRYIEKALDNEDIKEQEEASSTAVGESVSEEVYYITESDIEVGQYVTFGSYEQDNIDENGKEPIEWLILGIDDGMAVLISRYGLDCKPYNSTYENTTWEACSLRKWLNEDFYETAFNYEEQRKIETAHLSNTGDIIKGTDGDNNTSDKVFLLSKKEAEAFFGDDTTYFDTYLEGKYICNRERVLVPTKYAISEGIYVERINQWYNGCCLWWLRDAGSDNYNAAVCNVVGGIYEQGEAVNNKEFAVRPVILVNIEYEKKPIANENILNAGIENITPGSYITFGYYEQDGDIENGGEQLEWEILDVKDDKVLLTTALGIIGYQYGKDGNNTWENSLLRIWLNEDFYQTAFDSREKSHIVSTTEDKVFVLSVEEAKKYYPDEFEDENADRTIRPTTYGLLTGIEANENTKWYSMNCAWWLRSAGADGCVAVVNIFGCIDEAGDNIENINAVRPAIWVELCLEDKN